MESDGFFYRRGPSLWNCSSCFRRGAIAAVGHTGQNLIAEANQQSFTDKIRETLESHNMH